MLYYASQRRSFMIAQRYEFMRRFTKKRGTFEKSLRFKFKQENAKDYKKLKERMIKFCHGQSRKYLTDIIKQFRDHPSISKIKLYRNFSKKGQMEKIEHDFEHCISNNILSEEDIIRQKKKHPTPKRLPRDEMSAGSTVDSVTQSLRKLRKLSMLKNSRSHSKMVLKGGGFYGSDSEVSKSVQELFGKRSSTQSSRITNIYLTGTSDHGRKKMAVVSGRKRNEKDSKNLFNKRRASRSNRSFRVKDVGKRRKKFFESVGYPRMSNKLSSGDEPPLLMVDGSISARKLREPYE